MKLVIVIVSNDDASKVQKNLAKSSFSATRLQTSGNFLRSGNATFLIGVNDEKVAEVLEIIETHSKKRNKTVPKTIIDELGEFQAIPAKVEVGGATVFIVNVAQFLRI